MWLMLLSECIHVQSGSKEKQPVFVYVADVII